MTSAIVASGISKAFGDVQALDDLNLDVPEGAFFVLLGPSGAGKTTTLRVIAGLEKPDSGTVHLTGIDATGATPAERDLAMVFQSYALYPKQTAAANIASPLRARKLPKAEIDAQVARVAELLHIEKLMERKPSQLSGGEMQRVALGRALVRNPRAFLMDEPLTNLDLKLRVEMRTELTRIHRSLGRTFLYVTNDQVEAMSMADRLAVLRAGTVQQVGSPTEIYDRPANRWVATFVGSPRMNLLPCTANGRLEGTGWSLPNPGFVFQGDRPALLGVRSEDLSLDARDESVALDGTVYAVEPLGDRTLVDVEIGDQRIVIKAPPTASLEIGEQVRAAVDLDRIHLFDAETESAVARAMIDVPLTPVLRRARILERVQREGGASLADLASEHAVSPVTVHRDLELLSDAGPARARARGRPLAAGHPAADRGRVEHARARGRAREGRDRAQGTRAGRGRLDDLHRRVDDRDGAGARARAAPADRADAGHELPGDRARADGGLDLRDHAAGRARSAHARAHGPLDRRIPGRAEPGRGVHLGRRDHARARADDLAGGPRRHAERGRRLRAEDGRAAGLDEVQARLADDRAKRAVAGPDHHRRRARPGELRSNRTSNRAALPGLLGA